MLVILKSKIIQTNAGAIPRDQQLSHSKTFMNQGIEDVRIQWTKVVLPPVFLEEERPVSEEAEATILNARLAISRILAHRDPRLLVLVGPCSIHDTKAAVEYADLLKSAVAEFSTDLQIVMRVYFEKPRTTVGCSNQPLPNFPPTFRS